MSRKIDGTKLAIKMKKTMQRMIQDYKREGKTVTLAVIQVGTDPASSIYVRNKQRDCEEVGIQSKTYLLPAETTTEQLLEQIEICNQEKEINGILVQLPLPEHISEYAILQAIAPEKDVDGFHAKNIAALCLGIDGFVPCTPAGILALLKEMGDSLAGKQCVIVGRSNLVGKPMAQLLLQEDATVTICHSKTKQLQQITKQADILIVAIGQARFITHEYIKEGAIVIDVGMNRLEDGSLCGDVNTEDIQDIAAAVTPVPGGVGPMTRAMLLQNCIKAKQQQEITIVEQ